MNVDFIKLFRGLAWLAIHGPCMANYIYTGRADRMKVFWSLKKRFHTYSDISIVDLEQVHVS